MPAQITESGYFEVAFQGPYRGVHDKLPENMIPEDYTPGMSNFILKQSELRTRPKMSVGILGTPDNYPINVVDTFTDGNNVAHTVMVSRRGLWQLNPNYIKNPKKAWNLVGVFPVQPGPDIPVASQIFLNKFYWTNGANNLWAWDGITSVGTPVPWVKNQRVFNNFRIIDSNGNVQVVIQAGFTGATAPVWATTPGTHTTDTAASQAAIWVCNGAPAPSNGFYGTAVVDVANGITSGGFFLGILASRMLMFSTVEGTATGGAQNFLQRVRWCPSGLPSIWDPNVNIGAGYNDFLEVPDFITGYLAIGDKTGFVFRQNGISEMTAVSDGILPFDFNHLWASERGIGNVFSFSISGYGPIGMFISADDVYNISVGGFKNVGGVARDSILNSLSMATSTPMSTMFPLWANNYAYLVYLLAIPIGNDTQFWMYSVEEDSWVSWVKRNVTVTARANFVATR